MTSTTSADGTTIAFDVVGAGGPTLVLLPGATCTRGVTAPLAERLGERLTVVNVDRRGRGDSDDRADVPPYEAEREVEDVAAVIEAVGPAAVYGHSSGAALAIRAAAAGIGVTHLVAHDAPYNLPGDEAHGRAWHEQLHALLAVDRPDDAMAAFLGLVGMPAEAVESMREAPHWPALVGVAPTLAYDSAALGDRDGGLVPTDLLGGIDVPALVMAGGADHGFMIDVARSIAGALPDARFEHLVGAGHDAGPDVVAPPVLAFLLD